MKKSSILHETKILDEEEYKRRKQQIDQAKKGATIIVIICSDILKYAALLIRNTHIYMCPCSCCISCTISKLLRAQIICVDHFTFIVLHIIDCHMLGHSLKVEYFRSIWRTHLIFNLLSLRTIYLYYRKYDNSCISFFRCKCASVVAMPRYTDTLLLYSLYRFYCIYNNHTIQDHIKSVPVQLSHNLRLYISHFFCSFWNMIYSSFALSLSFFLSFI